MIWSIYVWYFVYRMQMKFESLSHVTIDNSRQMLLVRVMNYLMIVPGIRKSQYTWQHRLSDIKYRLIPEMEWSIHLAPHIIPRWIQKIHVAFPWETYPVFTLIQQASQHNFYKYRHFHPFKVCQHYISPVQIKLVLITAIPWLLACISVCLLCNVGNTGCDG